MNYDWSTPLKTVDGAEDMVQWARGAETGPPVTLGLVCAQAIQAPLGEGQEDAASLAQWGWAASQMLRDPAFAPTSEEITRIKKGLPKAWSHQPHLVYQVLAILDPGSLPERMRPPAKPKG